MVVSDQLADGFSLLHPLYQGSLEIVHIDVHQALLSHGHKNFGDGIVKQSVGTSRVEIQQSFQSGGREFPSNEGDKCSRNRFFAQIALPEDRQNVLNPRAGRLPKDIVPLNPCDVLRHRASTSQWESSVFVSPIKAPALMILDVYGASDRSCFVFSEFVAIMPPSCRFGRSSAKYCSAL